MKKIYAALAFASSLAMAGTAAADIVNTDDAAVLKGRLDLVSENTAIDLGADNLFGHTALVYYAPTDRLRFGGGVEVLDPPGGSKARVTGYVLEALYEGPQPTWLPFAWGIQAEYGPGRWTG